MVTCDLAMMLIANQLVKLLSHELLISLQKNI